MKRWALLLGIVLIFSAAASAQEYPKAEVFGGYSFARLSASGVDVNFNGGSASLSYNPNDWLGLVADFGGYHGGVDFGNGNVYTYLFGPKFARRSGRWTPYVQTLFGGAHASGEVSCDGGPEARPRPQQGFVCGSGSLNSFAMTLGGGVDVNASDHVGIRLIQAEYLRTHFASITENGTRISAGVVFRW
jgi:opacity protein-like surface antigen